MASNVTPDQRVSERPSKSNNKQMPSLRQLNDSVYEFYSPPDGVTMSLEIIFVHGVERGHYSKAYVETWTSFLECTVVCWPQTLLAEQFPRARILSVSYDSSIEKGPRQGNLDLYLTAENLVQDLIDDAKVAANPRLPVILVGKDFGGLVIKAICMKAKEQNRSTFLSNLKGIFYYGTPHLGVKNLPTAFNGALAERLMLGNIEIARLGSDFSNYRKERKWATRAILSLHTSEKVPELVISEASQRYDVDDSYTPNEGIDTVCKSQARTSSSFKCLTEFISRIERGKITLESSPDQGRTEEGVGLKTSLGFGPDENYVPMEETLAEVKNALQEAHIVVLHGGPGSGKSSLVRYLALQFEAAAQQEGTGVATTCSTEQSYWLPNGVVYLSCGHGAELTSMQRELLRKFNIEVPLLQHKSIALEGPAELQKMLRQELVEHLSKVKSGVVVILDDIWNREILENLLVPRDQVRYLLTTQISTLWNAHDSKRVQMQDATLEDARHILGNYSKFKGGVISEDLKNLGDEIIAATQSHPLALATLGTVLDNMGKTGKDWEEVKGNLLEHLETKDFPPSCFGQSYPLSVDVTMMVAFDLLDEDAKKLLYIITLFDGPFILETLLHLLLPYVLPKDDKINISKSIMSLAAKGLVRIETAGFGHIIPNSTSSSRRDDMRFIRTHSLHRVIWIHSLHQHFILSRKTKEISQITAFLDYDHDHTFLHLEERSNLGLAIALCALYGEYHIKERAVQKMGSRFTQKQYGQLASRLEPFVLLMFSEGDTKCVISQVATKVFLKYVYERELDDDKISHLLELTNNSSVLLVTLRVLKDIFFDEYLSNEEVKLIDEDHLRFVSVILSLLDSRDNAHGTIQEETAFEAAQIQLRACKALVYICAKAVKEKSTTVVLNVPDVLTVLVGLIQAAIQAEPGEQSDLLAPDAARILVSLAIGASADAALKICNTEGLLAGLVRSLSAHYNPHLQEFAAGALGILAIHANTRLKICNAEGALAGLIKSLSAHDNPGLQECAARALAGLALGDFEDIANHNAKIEYVVNDNVENLANCDVGGIKLKICNAEGALAGLVKSLAADDNHALQAAATMALANLTYVVVKGTWSLETGPLRGLVQPLSEHDNPRLQERTAWGLQDLPLDGASARKIRDEPGLLAALVQSLSASTNPDLQRGAAKALASLAYCGVDSRLKICEEEGALSGLTRSLSEHRNPGLQGWAATTLQKLAIDIASARKICDEPGSLAALIQSLSEHDSSHLQVAAGWTLRELVTDVASAWKICNEPGSLAALVQSLSSHKSPGLLQIVAAGALASLANQGVDFRSKICEEEGALSGLVRYLSEHDHPPLQEQAGWTLLSLGIDVASARKICDEPGSLAALVQSLSAHENPALQRVAAGALANLANQGVDFRMKICQGDGALSGLVRSLSEHDNPRLQEQAGWTLLSLAIDVASARKICDEPGPLAALIQSLSAHENPALQRVAAGALANLAKQGVDFRMKLCHEEGALSSLEKLLFQEKNADVQEAGARALWYLAFKYEAVQLDVANEKGAIEGLLRLRDS